MPVRSRSYFTVSVSTENDIRMKPPLNSPIATAISQTIHSESASANQYGCMLRA